jgi:nitrate reductase delta subunit
MSLAYRALALLISYPDETLNAVTPDALAILAAEPRLPARAVRDLARLAEARTKVDLYQAQEDYVWLFDRTRSLSLNLYEHVHGESRDRGQAMVDLIALYQRHGLELSGAELPDHLPVFLDFLSILPEDDAASLLSEAAHVLGAIGERLKKRKSPYAAAFAALGHLCASGPDARVLSALLAEPDEDPGDLEALDRLWAETAVTFGPGTEGCPSGAATAPRPLPVSP